MTTVTLEEAQAKLPELIENLIPGQEITITIRGEPVAQMKKAVRETTSSSPETTKPSRPGPGLCKGMITYIAPDFDAPLEDMREYME